MKPAQCVDLGAVPVTHEFPVFQYDPPRSGLRPFGAVTVGHAIFHPVHNADEFYETLGCDREAKSQGLLGEEFVWERYRRNGSKKSTHCLQARIRVFLHKHSEKFRKLYGKPYDATIGKCCAIEIDGRDKHCANCPMLPVPVKQP